MALKMLMPLLGQTMEEGTIIKWFKNEGDSVKAGEPLLEVMTDKVNMEVESPESGVLRRILAETDAIVPVKDPICIIAGADENIDSLLAEEASADTVPIAVPVTAAASSAVAEVVVEQAEPASGRVFASPAAKRVARERGVEINAVAGRGTGPGGRIVEKDVINYLASLPKGTPLAAKMAADMGIGLAAAAGTGVGGKVTSEDILKAAAPVAQAPIPVVPGTVIPFTGLRKAVAHNVAMSAQTAPHVTLVMEVDMSECVRLRTQVLPDVEKNQAVRISFTDIIIKAVARAIQDKPMVNSSLSGDQIVVHGQINIGVATAIEGGLVVPVVKDAAFKTLSAISREVKDLSARARSGQLKSEDYQGGTFTITNLGTYGVDSFNPIITPGQSAILGVCRIADKPVVVDGKVEVRPMMNLCLSFDHRVLDGAPAAEFLARVKQIVQTPYLIIA